MASDKCTRAGCTNPAAWYPVLLLYPVGYVPGKHAPARADMRDLKTCEYCKDQVTVNDLVDDKGWQRICASFAQAGSVRPDRNAIELLWGCDH